MIVLVRSCPNTHTQTGSHAHWTTRTRAPSYLLVPTRPGSTRTGSSRAYNPTRTYHDRSKCHQDHLKQTLAPTSVLLKTMSRLRVQVCENVVSAVNAAVNKETPVDLAPLLSICRVCLLCFGTVEIPEMIQCAHCSKKVHWDCIKLPEDIVKLVKKYFCEVCRDENGFVNE